MKTTRSKQDSLKAAAVKVRGAFGRLGQGLRVEEIVAVSGLTERAALEVLRHVPEQPKIGDYFERGAEGWFYDPFVDPCGRAIPAI